MTDKNTEVEPLGRILRTAEVMAVTGHSRTTIWRKVRDGTFPPPLVTGANSRGWPEQVLIKHRASLPTVSYAPDPEVNENRPAAAKASTASPSSSPVHSPAELDEQKSAVAVLREDPSGPEPPAA